MTRTSPSVAVVVLNYNGLADTCRCLESLRAVPYPNLSVILVDNASEVDPVPSAAAAFPGLLTLRNAGNLGYAGGNNRGIELALDRGADYILMLNNDTVVAPEIVTALVDAFEREPSLGVVGPVINYLDEPERVMTDGVRFNTGPGPQFFARLPVAVDGPRQAPIVEVDIVNGCCLMVAADAIRYVGMFDERLFIVHEESDFCLRAKANGYTCAVLGATLVWHKGSSSFERSGRRLQRYYDTRNLWYLLRRHAGTLAGSRRFCASVWQYLRYAFYRYAIEMEAGKPLAAAAVVDGVWDGLCGRTGIYNNCGRTGTKVIRRVFELRRAMRGH